MSLYPSMCCRRLCLYTWALQGLSSTTARASPVNFSEIADCSFHPPPPPARTCLLSPSSTIYVPCVYLIGMFLIMPPACLLSYARFNCSWPAEWRLSACSERGDPPMTEKRAMPRSRCLDNQWPQNWQCRFDLSFRQKGAVPRSRYPRVLGRHPRVSVWGGNGFTFCRYAHTSFLFGHVIRTTGVELFLAKLFFWLPVFLDWGRSFRQSMYFECTLCSAKVCSTMFYLYQLWLG